MTERTEHVTADQLKSGDEVYVTTRMRIQPDGSALEVDNELVSFWHPGSLAQMERQGSRIERVVPDDPLWQVGDVVAWDRSGITVTGVRTMTGEWCMSNGTRWEDTEINLRWHSNPSFAHIYRVGNGELNTRP